MADLDFARLQELFDAALELDGDERRRFLDGACVDRPELRSKVESLLGKHLRACEYFDRLGEEVAGSSLRELEVAERHDQQIGPYRTLRLLGEGGMGVVFLAERVDGQFEQQVALKLIRSGMESEAATARFLAERQILARLSHPNIARLLDGGVSGDGRPYFVMEHIEGEPLLQYCDTRRLTLARRLELFCSVCEAVRYAHQSLVLHRDLKPSNILVDRDGRVRLLDFGIAKLLEADEAASSGTTLTSYRPLTLPYAAPEQVLGESTTTATDTYALGLILYELLSGIRAQEAPTSSSRDLRRLILDVDPAPPSRRVITGSDDRTGPSPASIASLRDTRPERLRRALAGDLDDICLMALEKDPQRRYRSVDRLLEDVQRHLAGHPVGARRQTLLYRARKFVGRHPWGIVAAATLLAVLAVSFSRERSLRGQAERARGAAQLEASKAVAVSDFLADLLSSVDPSKAQGQEVTVAEVLDRAAEDLEGEHELREQPLVEAAVRLVLASTYRGLGKPVEAKPHAERALELRLVHLGERDPETLDAFAAVGILTYYLGRYDEAEIELQRLLEMRLEVLGEEHPDTLEAMSHLANVYWAQQRYAELESLDRKTLAIRQRVLGEDHPDTVRSLNGLAVTFFSTVRYAEAAEMFEQALEIQRRRLGPTHPDTLMAGNNLAAALNELGRYRESEALLREVLETRLDVLGEDQDDTAMSMHNLALALAGQARYGEASDLLRRAVAIRERRPTTDKTRLLQSKSHLADVYRDQNRIEEAETLYRTVLEELRRTEGAEDSDTLKAQIGLAELRLRRGEIEEAETLVVRSLEAQTRLLGAEHPNALQSQVLLARVRMAQQRFSEAETLSREAHAAARSTLDDDHPIALDAAFQVALALCSLERWEAAEKLAPAIHAARAERLGPEHPQTTEALRLVIEIYEALDDEQQAGRYRALANR